MELSCLLEGDKMIEYGENKRILDYLHSETGWSLNVGAYDGDQYNNTRPFG